MNLYLIQDPENDNFLTNRFNKWSLNINKFQFFTINNARRMRKDLKQKTNKKYIICEYELVLLRKL